MGIRFFVFVVLLGLTLSTLDAKSLKGHKKSKHDEDTKKNDEPATEEASGSAAGASAAGSGEESGSTEEAPPTEAEATSTPKLPFKVVGPLGGHPHPGPPAAYNPCPQPRYCDPARCKDPIGCAPSCSETCCADILIPPPTPPVGSGAGPCPDACAPTYQPSCCMGAPPPMATQPFPQPVYPPMGPQPGFAPPGGYGQPVVIPQPPPGGCGQSCLATNCAPPCPPQCCRRKKSVIHHHDRKTRSLTSRFAMCH